MAGQRVCRVRWAATALPAALLGAALLMGGCSDGPPQLVIEPPRPVIEMEGRWTVVNLQRFGSEPLPVDPGVAHEPFRPLHEGMELEVRDGRLRGLDGDPLFERFDEVVPNERWFQIADGRQLVLDFAFRSSDGCARREEIAAFFTPIDADRMGGSVLVVSTGDCAVPPLLPPAATGQFTMVLQRVYHPADGVPFDAR
ncbi:MAG: hypothetical protein AB7O97_11155 [Planctomycetota bacterium]